MLVTEAEKLIWAAAWVAELIDTRRVREQLRLKTEYHDDGLTPTFVGACAENAAYAVWLARQAVPYVEEGWGPDDEVYEMIVEMTEEE